MKSLLGNSGGKKVLELGCGSGDLTEGISHFADRIDAIDFSSEMLEIAKARLSNHLDKIHWHYLAAENFESIHKYDLICAGQSLQWMAWDVLFPKLRLLMTENASLAIVNRKICPCKWDSEIIPLIVKYSTNQDFQSYNLITELMSRKLFIQCGRQVADPIPFTQSIDDYINSFHSRNGFSRDRMNKKAASEFDQQLREIVMSYCPDGNIRVSVISSVVWGFPKKAS